MKRCLAGFLLVLPLCGQAVHGPRHLMGGANSPLTSPSRRPFGAIAQDFIQSTVAAELSLSPADVAGLYLAKEYQTAHNGVTHLIYRQHFSGADVYNAEWAINIGSDGSILNSGGRLFSAPAAGIFPPDSSSAVVAAQAAVRHMNSRLAANNIPRMAGAGTRRNGVRLAVAGLPEDVEGQPAWFGRNGTVQPAWVFVLTNSDGIHRYNMVVDSASNALMARRSLTHFQSVPTAPKGLVFERESPQPSPTPGVFLQSAPPFVDRTPQSLSGDPTASPAGWVAADRTAGNNTVVGENLLGLGFLATPVMTSATSGNFSFPLLLGAGSDSLLNYRDAANTNLFYWMNRAHDLHYQAGFDEASGNFQATNFGRGGTDGDPIYAYTHYGAAARTNAEILNSFFSTRGDEDGSPSMVAMFLSQSNNFDFFTDGAYDAQVMVHEYTHGVSHRLVRQGYSTFQGASMGEAWSDFFGLEYTTPDGAPADGTYALAQYFDQSWGSGDGRTRPYSTDTAVNPLTFADLGHVTSYSPEVHAEGEIWMEALWEMRSNLIHQFGETEGRRRVRMLVIDGMKLAVPAPSMVDARDGILLADQVDFKGASQSQIWAAFAKRGLGALAYSDGGDTVHVATSFDPPSSGGQLKFYDDPVVFGEPAIVILQDSSLTTPTVRVQLTSSSGDLEDLILFRNGFNYVGAISTSGTPGARQNGVLSLATGDAISAYYNHTGPPGFRQISVTAGTRPPYTRFTVQSPYTFSGERLLSLSSGETYIRRDLPFQFPFFSGKYGYVLVHENGLLSFDLPVDTSCTDSSALMNVNGIAPLFANLSVNGSAQSKEGIYYSQSTPDSMTFHWIGETVTPFSGPGHPVDFAATLFQDGRIQLAYNSNSNADLNFDATYYGCGLAPVDGLSNGHGAAISGLVRVMDTGTGFGGTYRWDPPFGQSTLPVATIESPAADQQVQGILTVAGIAYDTQSAITRVDIYIDGAIAATTTASVSRTDFCSGTNAKVNGCPLVGYSVPLNLDGLKLTAGRHNIALRVTNARGGFTDVSPVSFTVIGGQAQLPRAQILSPADGDTVSGTIGIKGWALIDTLRISGVDILIDGITYGPTLYGYSRTDICKAQATTPPNCPYVGFSLTLDTKDGYPLLLDGSHTMKVRVLDQTGRYTVLDDTAVTFIVKNGPDAPIVAVMTAPVNGQVLKGTVTMTGYAYSPGHKIISAVVYIDGIEYASAKINQPAADVCAGLTDVAACPNIGYSFSLNTTHFPNGNHVLGMVVFNDDLNYAVVPKVSNGGLNVIIQN